MKLLYTILTLLSLVFFANHITVAQSPNCATATPFCVATGITYPAVTGVASTGAYQCLLSMPNPTWFTMQIQNPGPIDINMVGGADVDFALWGPYPPGTNITTVCPTIFSSAANMIDCSYSSSATEFINIPAGAGNVTGAVYILLVTNFSGTAITINLAPGGGTGTTNCGIVPPCSLSLTCAANVTAVSTACGTTGSVTVPAPTVNYLSGTCGVANLTNSFNGTSNASGNYPIGTTNVTWTATSPVNGATATCVQTVTVTPTGLLAPLATNTSFCPTTSTTLSVTSQQSCSGALNWFTTPTGGTSFFTGSSYTFSPTATTTYYVEETSAPTSGGSLSVATLSTTGSAIVDIAAVSGDDRGGIAVTPTNVYVVGDANTVRTNLALGTQTTLPIRDGIFSDLNTGQLYSLWNTVSASAPAGTATADFTVNAIRLMDANLNYGATIMLSAPITVTSNTRKAGIFAGAGFLLIYTGGTATSTDTWVAINLPSGNVNCITTRSFSNAYSSENWANWGWGELISGSYFACYRNTATQTIDRMNVTTGAVSTIQTFTNLSDMASVVYSPFNSRLYFRFEGTAQFGGTNETLGYVPATHTGTTAPITSAASCTSTRTPVTATLLSASGPTVTNATICSSSPVVLGAAAVNGGTLQWYTAATGGTSFNTGTTYGFTPVANTTFYVEEVTTSLSVATISTTGSAIVDIDATSGDDRGGIAVTSTNVYVVGDNNTVRTNLALGTLTSLPIRDGIFSNLGTGQLYSLWNTTSGTSPAGTFSADYTVNSIILMDANLNYGATVPLSSPIVVTSNTRKAGIFAGCGFVLIYAGGSAAAGDRWYSISLPSGTVTSLGVRSFANASSTENWANWGWGEYNPTTNVFSACYRNTATQTIDRMNVSTGVVATIQTYTNLSDMASVVYSPFNNRLYFRYESGAQFGGANETVGYVPATHTGTCPTTTTSTFACPAARTPVSATIIGVPTNDNICGATTVFIGDNTLNTSSNTCATIETNEPRTSCFKDYDGAGAVHNKISKTIWCKFVAPTGAPYSYRFYIKTGNESNSPIIPATAGIFDAELGLFRIQSGVPCTNTFNTGLVLTEMACNDDHGVLAGFPVLPALYPAFSYTLVPGQTYYVMIDGATYDNAVASGVKREEALLATSTSNNITLTIEIDLILPIEWIFAKAEEKGANNLITWKSITKDMESKFEIERAENGINFTKIGEVALVNTQSEYSFVDNNPLAKSYYRIKCIDSDKKEYYSKSMYVNRGTKGFVLIEANPNPVKDKLEVTFESEKNTQVQLTIDGAVGNQVLSKEIQVTEGVNNISLDFSGLPKGVYLLNLTSDSGRIVKKIIKE